MSNSRPAAFEHAISNVLTNEGGYINHATDNGGETKFGVSKRSYPDVDIRNLTVEQAKEIYYRDFWQTGPYDELVSLMLIEKIFDTAINVGNSRAFKFLQQAVNKCGGNLVVDGQAGPKTIAAANAIDGLELLEAYRTVQADFYRELAAHDPSQRVFLKGWLKRAAS